MEDRFSNIEDDGSNQYLLMNLNPILTSVYLLQLLKNFELIYSVTGLRTFKLSEIILKQAQSVLQNLFHPEIMKYQLR